jgi:hypothetical protein
MPEFPFEPDDGAPPPSPQACEAVAKYRAMPRRSIVSLLTDGRAAILDCGHWKTLLVPLREGDSVRCRDCYDAGMRQARQMIQDRPEGEGTREREDP